MGVVIKSNITSGCDFCSQMSQYASMYSISKKTGMDIAFREMDLYHNYGYHLDKCFNHIPKILDNYIDVKPLPKSEMFGNLDQNLIYDITDDISLYTNYNEYEEELKDLYTFREEILNFSKNFIEQNLADDEESVSIHFRRGDYLQCSSLNLSLDYYKAAVDLIKEKTEGKKLKFFIFSNGIEWVEENFKLDNCVYVKGLDRFHDLCIMSLCDHNIIANSSFSYWGAYLNRNLNKIVICPYNYTNGHGFDGEYFPTNWNSIKIN